MRLNNRNSISFGFFRGTNSHYVFESQQLSSAYPTSLPKLATRGCLVKNDHNRKLLLHNIPKLPCLWQMEPTQNAATMESAAGGQVDQPSNSSLYFIYAVKSHELPSPNAEAVVPFPPSKILKHTDNQFALNTKECLDRLGKRDKSLSTKWDSKLNVEDKHVEGPKRFVAVVSFRGQTYSSADGALFNSMAEAEQELAEKVYSEQIFPFVVVAKQEVCFLTESFKVFIFIGYCTHKVTVGRGKTCQIRPCK